MRGVVFIPANVSRQDPRRAHLLADAGGSGASTTTSIASVASLPSSCRWAFVDVDVRPVYSERTTRRWLRWRSSSLATASTGPSCRSPRRHLHQGLEGSGKLAWLIGNGASPTLPKVTTQALGCTVVTAWDANTLDVIPVKPDTIAKSLRAMGKPADGYYSLKIIKQTRRRGDLVTNPEIIKGIKLLARHRGHLRRTGRRGDRRRAQEATRRRNRPGRAGRGLRSLGTG